MHRYFKIIKLEKHIKKIVAATLAVALCAMLAGCTSAGEEQGDILTQKPTEDGRTLITVLVKYAFSINNFETIVEEKFPDIDIVQVGNFTSDMDAAEYEARMEHDDLTDIVMTWPMEAGEEYMQDRLLDLSGMDFTSRYNLSMLNNISRNGELYYLPGPSQLRGIVYNKTLFEENGWRVPKSYEEFLALCKTIEQSGIRSIQLGFKNPEVLDTAFVGYNYGDYFSKPQDAQWLKDFNAGNASFERMKPALEVFRQMADAGVWKPNDLEIDYATRETMLFTRQCAMIEDSVLMARMGESMTGSEDEFALMPFLNPGEDGDWARLYMVCYIGLNNHLAEPQNKEKYDKVLKLMDYISTAEGQEALASDTGAVFSSLVGVEMSDVPEIQEVLPALTHGRYAKFPQLENAGGALRTGLAGILLGMLTSDEVVQIVDEQNAKPPEEIVYAVLGEAKEDFSILETGNFVTDAMRVYAETDIALFMDNGKDGRYNGKGISGKIYEGDVTELDVRRILPDIKHGETGTLWKLNMTGEELISTLEYSIPVDNNAEGWFYYFSGLNMEYDPVATPGERIKSIGTADGKQIEPQKLYSIAVMDETVPSEYIKDLEETSETISNIVSQAIIEASTIVPANDGRFVF